MRKKSLKNRKKSERKLQNEQKVTLSAQCCQMATTIILRYKHDININSVKMCWNDPYQSGNEKKKKFLNRFCVRTLEV